MSSSAVFLNKEERSIKKGFDLTFHSAADEALWYGEVKSGIVADDQTADQKSGALLATAASDIASKLDKGAERSRWDSAIADARVTLASGQAASARELLRSDAMAAQAGAMETKNVMVAAVVMHSIGHCSVSTQNIRQVAAKLQQGGRFSSVAVLVAQQHEIESVIEHLREVVTDA